MWLSMIDFVGNWGPLWMILIALWMLQQSGRQVYIYYFVTGLIVNTLLNIILKGAIQQPRPDDMDQPGAFQKRVRNILATRHGLPFNLFGMPSGHAQAVLYIWSFLYAVLYLGQGEKGAVPRNWIIKWLMVIIGIIVLVQRVEWGHHTWFQVAVGAAVGVAMGAGAYWMGYKKTVGRLAKKADDGAIWSYRVQAGFL